MSAFMCSDKHIAILAQFAAFDPERSDTLRIHPGCLYDKAIGIAFASDKYRCSPLEAVNYFAAVLYETNEIAMQHRYGDAPKENPPQFTEAPTITDIKEFYKHVSLGQIAKLAASYAYQACEHEDWCNTKAYHLIARINECLVRAHPDYETADWRV